MRLQRSAKNFQRSRSWWLRRYSEDKGGATAIEYTILAPLFFILTFSIIEVAMIGVTSTGVRAGLSDVGREIRTGREQCFTEQEMVQEVCRFSIIGYCDSSMEIEQSVIGAGGAADVDAVADLDAGQIVLIRANYDWRVINPLLVPLIGDGEGVANLTSSLVFRSEQFDSQTC